MKLSVFNGSPRNRKSNSKILMEHFLEGYGKHINDDVPICYLANRSKLDESVVVFSQSETAIIIFPLYTDCMPGIVKEFFEHIALEHTAKPQRVGYIVQSGFPEAIHSLAVERYLKKFTTRLGCEYLGTVIKGGVEGIQIMPPSMTRKLYNAFRELGEGFACNGRFNPSIVERLGKPLRLSPVRQFIFSVGCKLGLANFYWNSNLKKNNAFGIRFARPYLDEGT